jgi:hypothetical protein
MGDKNACLEPNLIVLNENVWFNIRCFHRIVFLPVQMLVLPEFKGEGQAEINMVHGYKNHCKRALKRQSQMGKRRT